jgi:uncharacterized protein YndB with AHSA1/START domain
MTKKIKYTLEIEIKSSPAILYAYISTPSGLSEWFCDDINVNQKEHTFKWSDTELKAELLKSQNNRCVRFHWQDSSPDEYFEMEIRVDEITGDVALIVTDFAEENDIESSQQLWESQVQQLKLAIGS